MPLAAGLRDSRGLPKPFAMLSVFDEGAFAPCPARFNLAAHVLAAGAATPDKIALSILTPSAAEHWSYARLIAAVRGTATGLLQAGLEPGQILLLRQFGLTRWALDQSGQDPVYVFPRETDIVVGGTSDPSDTVCPSRLDSSVTVGSWGCSPAA